MTDQSYTTSFTVERTPTRSIAAINDVRGWWEETLVGRTHEVSDEFIHWVPGVHFARIRVDELLPGKRVVWRVLDNWMSFIDDQSEWTGTEIRFDIAAHRRRDRGPLHPRRPDARRRVLRRLPRRLGHVHHGEPAGVHRDGRRPAGAQRRRGPSSGAGPGRPRLGRRAGSRRREELVAAYRRRYPPYERRNSQPGSDSTVAFVPHWG